MTEPDPEAQRVLDMLDELDAPEVHEVPPEEAREQFEQRATLGGPAAEVGSVEERTVPGRDGALDARVYRPPEEEEPHPALAFFHGGGFVVGSPATHDDLARALCAESGRVVVSVDYRLAPEHPFPAAVLDAYHATAWLGANAGEVGGDPDRLAVAGDSAGGTLAAVTCLLARDRRRGTAALPADLPDPPAVERQVLYYPATSYGRTWDSRERDEAYLLTDEQMTYFAEQYLRHALEGYNRYAYPLEAADFSGLPPATVVTAGLDPLHDEGVAYAEALADAGVAVAHHDYERMIHGFGGMLAEPGQVSTAWDALETVAGDL